MTPPGGLDCGSQGIEGKARLFGARLLDIGSTESSVGMPNRLAIALEQHPLLTAVIYTGIGVLPLFLLSAQILQVGRELDFGVGRLGIATAAFFGSAALAANLAGRLMVRVGSVGALRVGSTLSIISCLAVASATALWMIPVALAVGGFANGTIQVAANIAIFDGVKARRQGLAFGSKQAAVPMASVLAGLSLPLVASAFGWRWVFVAAAVLALVLTVSVPNLESRKEVARKEDALGRPPLSLVLLAVGGICGAAAGNGISLFIVPSAVEVGFSEPVAGIVLSSFSILVVAVRVGSGWLVDRRNSTGHVEMMWLAGAGAVGALVLMAASTQTMYLLAMPVAVLGAWGWPGIFFFTVVRSYPRFPARATGLVLSGNLAGTLIGPLAVGALAGQGRFQSAWLFVSITAGLSTAALASSFVTGRRISEVSAVQQP